MNLRAAAISLVGMSFLLMLPAQAAAQRKLWGVSASLTPVWTTEGFSKYLNNADGMNMKGRSFRFGVSRGGTLLGDWSLLFVRREFKAGGLIDKDHHRYTTRDNVMLNGFEVEKFAVKGTVKDRLLFGIVVAAGGALVQGTMTSDNGSSTAARDVLRLGTSVKIQPLFRLEFGVGVIVARGFRVRASGGFDWSGFSASAAATYFFGDR